VIALTTKLTSKTKDTQNKFEFDEDKFKELVLYISDKCEQDPDYGAVKLNKILFYSDFYAYLDFGKPITGAEYIALEHGPAPKLLAPIRREMEGKDIIIRENTRFGNRQVRVIPRRDPDLSKFSAQEIALVDEIINKFCGANAKLLSEISHLERCWQVAETKETIPYQAAFLSAHDATPSDIKRANELALKLGW
jgi:hypothetical protein